MNSNKTITTTDEIAKKLNTSHQAFSCKLKTIRQKVIA